MKIVPYKSMILITLIGICSGTFAQEINIPSSVQTIPVVYQETQEQEQIETVYQNSTPKETPKILPNNICFEIVKKHLLLAKITGGASPTDEALLTLKNIEDLAKTDILQAISLSPDKKATLTTYLNDANTYLEKGSITSIVINQELALLKLDMKACQADKDSADREYFRAVDIYDTTNSQTALEQSITNDICVTENRIQYNAKAYVLDRIAFFGSILKQKYDIILENQDLIINHFDVISDQLLQKLEDINSVVNTYQF